VRFSRTRLSSRWLAASGLARQHPGFGIFIDSFPKNETNLDWIAAAQKAKGKYTDQLALVADDVVRLQKKLREIERQANLSIAEIKDINRRMSIGEAKALRKLRHPTREKGYGRIRCKGRPRCYSRPCDGGTTADRG
jgi:hypothetical protein